MNHHACRVVDANDERSIRGIDSSKGGGRGHEEHGPPVRGLVPLPP